MLDQFYRSTHPYIHDVIDAKADDHCGYRFINALLEMGGNLWSFVIMDLFKEIRRWYDEYATLLDDYKRVDQLKNAIIEGWDVNGKL